ncbi:hypothetical protein SNEBB_001035 [Seison nebaliae]|nr:hypothetical protein SNEBB_001035 [Seison nebaliae]
MNIVFILRNQFHSSSTSSKYLQLIPSTSHQNHKLINLKKNDDVILNKNNEDNLKRINQNNNNHNNNNNNNNVNQNNNDNNVKKNEKFITIENRNEKKSFTKYRDRHIPKKLLLKIIEDNDIRSMIDSDDSDDDDIVINGNIQHRLIELLNENSHGLHPQQPPNPSSQHSTFFLEYIRRPSNDDKKLWKDKLILFWNEDKYLKPSILAEKCSAFGNCFGTFDREQLTNSDAVIFHSRHINKEQFPMALPLMGKSIRLYPNQHWIFYSPYTMENDIKFYGKFNSIFNLTMMGRKDADIPIFYYHLMRRLKKIQFHNFYDEKKEFAFIRRDTVCNSQFFNLTLTKLTKRLQKPITIIGLCNRTDPCNQLKNDNRNKCQENEMKRYLFSFFFDDELQCSDHLPDSIWKQGLMTNTVPVLLTGHDKIIDKTLKDALIHWNSKKDFVEHLQNVAASSNIYNSYHDWRINYEVKTFYIQHWCNLCRTLNAIDNKQRKSFKHFSDWIKPNCSKPIKF